MAQTVFSIAEIVRFLRSNDVIPEEVAEISPAEDDIISLKVKTSWLAPKHVRIAIKYVAFRDGRAIFEVVRTRLMHRFDWLIRRILASSDLPDCVSCSEYPMLQVDANRVLTENIKGITIESITFTDSQFRVTTSDA